MLISLNRQNLKNCSVRCPQRITGVMAGHFTANALRTAHSTAFGFRHSFVIPSFAIFQLFEQEHEHE